MRRTARNPGATRVITGMTAMIVGVALAGCAIATTPSNPSAAPAASASPSPTPSPTGGSVVPVINL